MKHLDKIIRIQRKYRTYKACPKKLNIPRFKSLLLATLVGWKTRRAFEILRNDVQTSEAMDIIMMHEDTRKQGENLFFKQLLEKFPEKIQLFHSKLKELLESKTWLEKPVVQKRILVSARFLTLFRPTRMCLNQRGLKCRNINPSEKGQLIEKNPKPLMPTHLLLRSMKNVRSTEQLATLVLRNLEANMELD